MKSKLVILSLMLASAATAVNGQTKEKYVNEKASDNIFVSVTVALLLISHCLWVSGLLRFGEFVPKVVCGEPTSTHSILMVHSMLLVML